MFPSENVRELKKRTILKLGDFQKLEEKRGNKARTVTRKTITLMES